MAGANEQTVDTAKVRSVLSTWDQALNAYKSSVESNSAAKNDCLKKLADAGLDSGFIKSFDANFKALAESLKQVSSSLKKAVGYIEDNDRNNRDNMPDDDGGGGDDSAGGDDEETTEPPTSGIDNMSLQIEEYKKMSMNDLQSIVDTLQKTAEDNNMTIEELLGDKQNAELIKQALLDSIKSEELRKLIEEGDIELTRQLIVNILTGEEPEIMGIDSNTVLTLSKYLESIANNNNITVDDLVGKAEYTSLLKTSLTSFGDIGPIINGTTSENIIETMKNINNGNYSVEGKDPSGVIGIVRSHLAALAEANNLESEDSVFESTDYANSVGTLGTFSVFASNASKFNDNNMIALVKNTLLLLKDAAEGQSE